MTNHEQFVQDRLKGVGGSDVAAIFGLSQYKTPLALYMEKIGATELFDTDNDFMYWGRMHEPTIVKHYKEITGNKVKCPKRPIVNKDYPWLRANVDGLVIGKPIVLEVKTAYYKRAREYWGEPGSDKIPMSYVLQVQHYMLSTNRPSSDIAVLINGCEYRQYVVEFDRTIGDQIIDKTHDFWHNHVLKRIPPDPLTRKDVMLLRLPSHSHDKADQVVANDKTIELVKQIKGVRNVCNELKTNLKELNDKLAIKFKDKTVMVDSDEKVIATFKPDVRGCRQLRINI